MKHVEQVPIVALAVKVQRKQLTSCPSCFQVDVARGSCRWLFTYPASAAQVTAKGRLALACFTFHSPAASAGPTALSIFACSCASSLPSL